MIKDASGIYCLFIASRRQLTFTPLLVNTKLKTISFFPTLYTLYAMASCTEHASLMIAQQKNR